MLVAPAGERRRLQAAREAIAALGVQVHQPGEVIAVEAARLRNAQPISLPEAYCLATARHTDSSIASFDDKLLRAAEREGIAATQTTARRRRQR